MKFPPQRVERVEGRERTEEASPNEPGDDVHAQEEEEAVKKIGAGRVAQMTEDVDRIFRPKRDAAGEITDVSEVKREVAEVVRRLHFELVAIDEDEPAENAEGKEGKDTGEEPEPGAPDGRAAVGVLVGGFLRREKRPDSEHRPPADGEECAPAVQSTRHQPEQEPGNDGSINEGEPAREPLHGWAAAAPLPEKSGTRPLKKSLKTFALR